MIVLGSNIWPAVQRHIVEIQKAIGRARPGTYEFIEIVPPPRKIS